MPTSVFDTLINAADLHNLISQQSVSILDCRFSLAEAEWGRKEYRSAHIPGALYAHLEDDLSAKATPGKTGRHPLPAPDQFAEKLGRWGIHPHDQVVVYDQSHGGLASRAWWMMQWLGHRACALLDGGWAAWTAQQYPVTSETLLPLPTQYQYTVQGHLTVNADEVNTWRQMPQHCVVDARIHARYLGETEPIDPVAGHIPGAINLPFTENVHPDGTWKSAQVLRTRFEQIGTLGSDRVAMHCGSGVTACHNILACRHAGLGMPKLYPGSWSEWITDPDRPVAVGE